MNPDNRPRRTWSDEARRTNRRRRLLRRLTRRVPLLAKAEYERIVLARPDYYGVGTALPPPVRRAAARTAYRTRHQFAAERRRALYAQVDAFRRKHGWEAVYARLRQIQRHRVSAWIRDHPWEAARAFPLFAAHDAAGRA